MLSGAISGVDGNAGMWVWEETAQQSLTQGFRRWINSKQTNRKIARLMGRHGLWRAYILSWDGAPQWVVVPYEDWVQAAHIDAQEGL